MANRFSLEASIEPTVDRRAADREGERLAGEFEDSLGNLGVDLDSGGIGDLGGGGRSMGASGGDIGITLVGLATQRNDLLSHIAESLDESFVGSGGGGGGIAEPILNILLLRFGGGRFLAGGGASGGTLSGLAGSIGLRGAGAVGATGILRYRQSLMEQGRSRESIDPSNLQGRGDAGGIGGTGVGETGIEPPSWLSDLTEWSLPQTPAGWMEDFISWGLPGATPWLTDFIEWSLPAASSWINDFIGWEFDSPAWINDFIGWEFDSPAWIDQFLNWEFTIPDAPAWVSQLLSVSGMGGRGGGRSEAARRGGGFQSDQGLFNAANRQNQAADRNRTDVRINPQIDLDPSQVARELVPEVERFVDDALSNIEDSLRQGAQDSQLVSSPGRRFG